MDFILATDSSCDLPYTYLDTHHVALFCITATINDVDIQDDLGKSYSYKDFYNQIREGAMPITSQVNSFTFKEKFETWVKADLPILYIAFSSGLSGTYHSAVMARSELLETYPDAQITIIDSRCASGGLGLLIKYACEMKEAGKSFEEIVDFVSETKEKMFHIFTVDDLNHLKRGGRVSPTAAFVGTMLQIKPILYVSHEGTLIPYQKARGRKKALHSLVEHFEKFATTYDQSIMITHTDCEEDAIRLSGELKEKFNVPDVLIHSIGPAIGAHTGANIISLFFIAHQKTPIVNK